MEKLKKIVSIILSFIMIFTFPVIPAIASEEVSTYYVSPNGRKDATGTLSDPFPNIKAARDYLRTVNRDMQQDIDVVIADGVYELSESLCFDERDSGHNNFSITYQAEDGASPIISGGVKISGWTQVENSPLWSAPITDKRIKTIRQMYVGDKKAVRARGNERIELLEWYDNPEITIFNPPENEDQKLYNERQGFYVPSSDIGDWINPTDIELHFSTVWNHHILHVKSIGPEENGKRYIQMQPMDFYYTLALIGHNDINIERGVYPYVVNAFELLDEPGEFYFNKKERKIYYMPELGEDLTKTPVYAPLLDTVLRIEGSSEASRVHDLRFEGLTFAYGAWNEMDQFNLFGGQSARIVLVRDSILTPSGVVVNAARNISFVGNTFRDMGSGGLEILKGVENCIVEGNIFADLGTSAITVGHYEQHESIPVEFDIALNKKASGGGSNPESVNDGTGAGMYFDTADKLWTVDLEEGFQLNAISLQPMSGYEGDLYRKNIVVEGANYADFRDRCILYQISSAYVAGERLPITDLGRYRYLRIRQTGDVALSLSNVSVYGFLPEYVSLTDGKTATSSAPLDTEHTAYMPISNELYKGSGFRSSDSDVLPWWSVDLGRECHLGSFRFLPRQDVENTEERKNFLIEASRNSDFSDSVILFEQGSDEVSPYKPIHKQLYFSETYRYVRIRKTAPGVLGFGQFGLYGIDTTEEGKTYRRSPTNTPGEGGICKNVQIINNYITRVGAECWQSAGIQTFYTQELVISHNFMEEVPYSGIAVGWGWNNYLSSVTHRNTLIENNIIHRSVLETLDAGSIYTLGHMPVSIIRGNYLSHQGNVHGSILNDNSSNNIYIAQNAIEAGCLVWMCWDSDKISFQDNYATSTAIKNDISKGSVVEPIKTFMPMRPGYAGVIKENAGLTDDWKHLSDNSPKSGYEFFGFDDYGNQFNTFTRFFGDDVSGTKTYIVMPILSYASVLLEDKDGLEGVDGGLISEILSEKHALQEQFQKPTDELHAADLLTAAIALREKLNRMATSVKPDESKQKEACFSSENLINITDIGFFDSNTDVKEEGLKAFDGNMETAMDISTVTWDSDRSALSLRFNRGYDIRKIVVKSNYTHRLLESSYFRPSVGNIFGTHGDFKNAIFTSDEYKPYNVEMNFNTAKSNDVFGESVLVYEVPAENHGMFQAFGLYFDDVSNMAELTENIPEEYKDDKGNVITTPKIYEIEVYATAESVNLVNVGIKSKSRSSFRTENVTFTQLHSASDPESDSGYELEFFGDGWGCIDLVEPTEIEHIQLTPLNVTPEEKDIVKTALWNGMDIVLCNSVDENYIPIGVEGVDKATLLSCSETIDADRYGANPYYLKPAEAKKYRYVCYNYSHNSDKRVKLRWNNFQIFANPARIGQYDGYRELSTWSFNVNGLDSQNYRAVYFYDFKGRNGTVENSELKAELIRAHKLAFIEIMWDGDVAGTTAKIHMKLNDKTFKIPFEVTGGLQRIYIPDNLKNQFASMLFVYKAMDENGEYIGSISEVKVYTDVYNTGLVDIAPVSDAPDTLFDNDVTYHQTSYSSPLTITLDRAQYISHVDFIGATDNVAVTAIKEDGTEDILTVNCPVVGDYKGNYAQAIADCGMKKYKGFRINSASGTSFGLGDVRVLAYVDTNTYIVDVSLEKGMLKPMATAVYLSALDNSAVQLALAGYSLDGSLEDIEFGTVTSINSARKTVNTYLDSKPSGYCEAFIWNANMRPLTAKLK